MLAHGTPFPVRDRSAPLVCLWSPCAPGFRSLLKGCAAVLALMVAGALLPTPAWAAAPVVGGLAITSQPGPDRTYGEEGDYIRVALTFDQVVHVTGTPSIALQLGETVREADYQLGSGSPRLVFRYAITPGDLATDGVAIEAGSIALNGGSITNVAGEVAELAHPALASDPSHLVDRRCVLDAGLVTSSGTFNLATSGACLIPVRGRPNLPGLELYWQVPDGVEHSVVFVSGDSAHPTLDTTTVGVVNGTRRGVDDGIVCNALGECGGADDYHAPFRFTPADLDANGRHAYAAYQYGRTPGPFGTATVHVTLVPRILSVSFNNGECGEVPSLAWNAPDNFGRAVSWIVLLSQDGETFPKRRGRPGVYETVQPTIRFPNLPPMDQTYHVKVLPQVLALGSFGYQATGRVENALPVAFSVKAPPVFLPFDANLVLRVGIPMADQSLTMPRMSMDCGPYKYDLCRKVDTDSQTCDSGALPPGLAFDATTGTITGTPTAVEPAAQYLYTVSNRFGYAVSSEISLAIAGAAAAGDTPPSIVSMRFDNLPAEASRGYAEGEEISLEATFDRPVSVSRLPAINFSVGNQTRHLVYADGSGMRKLRFTYTVTACDTDEDGIAVGTDAFDVTGGVVVADGNRIVLADLTHEPLDGGSVQRVAASCPDRP